MPKTLSCYFLMLVSLAPVSAEDGLTELTEISRIDVHPKRIALDSERRSIPLIVTAYTKSGQEFDVTDTAKLRSSDAKLVRLDANRVIPVSDGTAQVIATFGDSRVTIPVTVKLKEADPISLRNEVLPILSRQGCSSGACHGSPKGKAGFRLSLRAFDPLIDESTLRKEFFGRRTNPLNPDTSLLLKKPLTEVPHAGGRRLRSGTASHQLLRAWIGEGVQLDAPATATCQSIDIHPKSGRELTERHPTQRFSVLATFTDNSIRDVTHLAVFTSSDTSTAEVNESGLVTRVKGSRGQTAITVRYLEHMATSFVLSVPSGKDFTWSDPPESNYVDKLVNNRLRQLQFIPSERCSDAEFVRRVSLDVTGLLPTVKATRDFINDQAVNKRAKLIDQLLTTSEHAKFMALKWGDTLRIRQASITSPGVFKYHRWLVRAFQNNMPYDKFARQLLTSSGSTFETPTANYFRTAANTNDSTESTAQIFLGARLECAKCHNHPHERWTQDNYYGLGSFFHRVQRDSTERPNELFISIAQQGEVTQPRTSQVMKPWLPGKGEIDIPADVDRRTVLADWLVETSNRFSLELK